MREIDGALVFDSWASALPGVRASVVKERHLIYEGGGVLLDLLLKPELDGSSLEVGGQVLPTDNAPQNVSHVPVVLQNGGISIRTRTNALGEFSFKQSHSSGHFDISIVLGTNRFVVRGLESAEPRKWQVVPAGFEKAAHGGLA